MDNPSIRISVRVGRAFEREYDFEREGRHIVGKSRVLQGSFMDSLGVETIGIFSAESGWSGNIESFQHHACFIDVTRFQTRGGICNFVFSNIELVRDKPIKP